MPKGAFRSLSLFHMNGTEYIPESKVHEANMGPIWGRQDPGGPNVGPMNFAIWDVTHSHYADVIMNAMASNRRGLDCLLNRLFRGRPVTGGSPHKGPATRKTFLFDDVIMNGAYQWNDRTGQN